MQIIIYFLTVLKPSRKYCQVDPIVKFTKVSTFLVFLSIQPTVNFYDKSECNIVSLFDQFRVIQW
jgi:hypothetical protein